MLIRSEEEFTRDELNTWGEDPKAKEAALKERFISRALAGLSSMIEVSTTIDRRGGEEIATLGAEFIILDRKVFREVLVKMEALKGMVSNPGNDKEISDLCDSVVYMLGNK